MSALPTYLMDCETCRHCGTRLSQPEDSDLLEICGECAADLAEAEKRRDL
jgi:predicted nucleic acid-binding Zn ribbon protein